MPYANDSEVPSYVPSDKRAQWREVWNIIFSKTGDEKSAFRQANGTVKLSEFIPTNLPKGIPKIPANIAVYIELPSAVKDAQCLTVEVSGGVSQQHGCCNLWDEVEGEQPANFQCGSCKYHTHAEHSIHLSDGGEMTINPIIYTPNSHPHRHLFAYGLVTMGDLIPTSPADRPLYRIPMAYTGTFVKGDDRFQITRGDLLSIIKNFKKKPTGAVNVDYEHASENPEVAHGGPLPAAAWISDVELDETSGEPILMGTVEYTTDAMEMLKKKEYRFFSPAIDWAAIDKTTGIPQGATLTSAALTNRPFLEKLPPLLMSDVPRLLTEEKTMADTKKMFRLKKNKDGKIDLHASGASAGDFGELMGEIEPKDFEQLSATKPATSSPGEPDLPTKMSEVLGESHPVQMTDVKKFYDAGKKSIQMVDAQTGQQLLSECITDDGLNKQKSRKLLADNKVSPQQYAAFENAYELVEQGVSEGKLHPSNRAYHLTEAITRPTEFESMLKNSKPFIHLGEHGLSGVDVTGRTTQAGEVDITRTKVLAYMKDNKCNYSKALKEVTSGDGAMAQRLRDGSRKARMM